MAAFLPSWCIFVVQYTQIQTCITIGHMVSVFLKYEAQDNCANEQFSVMKYVDNCN